MMTSPFRRARWIGGKRAANSPAGGFDDEQGITMVIVALSMVALIAMAALSIDVVTLYLNREEAQRSADAAALAAARVISVSGITGAANPSTDNASWKDICGLTGTATEVAKQVAAQNAIGGVAPTVTVNYSIAGSAGGVTDCSGLAQAFAINPTVIVQVRRTGLPTMFSRIWSRASNTVSATAAAEVFNPSDSGTVIPGGQVIPVAPRCVKPWIIPDEDTDGAHPAKRWVGHISGRISTPGIFPLDTGVVGEQFTLTNNCTGPNCTGMTNPPPAGSYIPALISATSPIAVPPGCSNNQWQNSISGCDVSTVYQCGTPNGAQMDLSQSRGADTAAAVKCLTGIPTGNDTIDPTTYPFPIRAGSSNLIAASNQLITASNSIMTLPIYDDWMGSGRSQPIPTGTNTPQVTILGYMQVFVTGVDPSGNGNMNVVVLNVAGCGNNASTTTFAQGSSPVPIRLITTQ